MARPKGPDYKEAISDGVVTRVITNQGDEFYIDTCALPLLAGITWYIHKARGYVYGCGFGRKGIKLHRYLMQPKADEVVDHIDGNFADNRLCNLRVCTQAENCRNNTRPRRNKRTSQYKGVHFGARENKWKAQIQIDKKKISLGTFKTEIEAAVAYDTAAVQYHGQFAALNFPKKIA